MKITAHVIPLLVVPLLASCGKTPPVPYTHYNCRNALTHETAKAFSEAALGLNRYQLYTDDGWQDEPGLLDSSLAKRNWRCIPYKQTGGLPDDLRRRFPRS